MLELYLAALIFGGGLLLISAVAGGHDHDADHDVDGHDGIEHDAGAADHDVDHDLDADHGLDADHALDGGHGLPGDHAAHLDQAGGDTAGGAGLPSHLHGGLPAVSDVPFLPFLTVRFWTFGSTFFGLFGTLGTWLGVASSGITLALSVVAGALSGGVASYVIHRLKSSAADSSVRDADWEGATADVLLPITSDRQGKVRVTLKGRTLDIRAVSRGRDLGPGDRALVVEHRGDHVIVESL